jgi:hypothetical protein
LVQQLTALEKVNERLAQDQKVSGSNPVAPTNFILLRFNNFMLLSLKRLPLIFRCESCETLVVTLIDSSSTASLISRSTFSLGFNTAARPYRRIRCHYLERD